MKKCGIPAAVILLTLLSCTVPDKDESVRQDLQEISLPTYADSVNAGIIGVDTLVSSPRRTASADFSTTGVTIEYGSPGVRGRTIWGDLVPYGQVWAAGAHNATSIEFDEPLVIGGQRVGPGKYAIFIIPDQEEWTFLINTRYDQHLTDDYSEEENVLSQTVVPEYHHKVTPRLTYQVEPRSQQKGTLYFLWEHVKISVPLETGH